MRRDLRLPLLLALLLIAGHVVVNATTGYGVHRDEFLYLAMGRHLQVWRMDFPIAMALLANASRLVSDALWAIRLTSAIAGSALVVVTAWLALRLGARAGSAALAALAVACGPVFFGAANLFQPVVFDQLWWMLALAALAWTRANDQPRGWLLVGAALGLGLLTKFSIAFIGVGILVALVAGPRRRELLGPWPWLGAALALAIGSPSLVGQVRLGWPVVGQMSELHASQLARTSALDFMTGQPLILGPSIVLALVGLAWLLRGREQAWHRELAIAPLVALLLLLLGKGKAYYGAPAFPALVAAGAAAMEGARPLVRRLTLGGVAAAGVAFAACAAPIALPLLAPARTAAYLARLGLASAHRMNTGEPIALPQDEADMLGWEGLADSTAAVVATLSPAERAGAVIVAANYGRAGALEFYAASRRLPPVVSPNGSFWFWGPGDRPGDPVLVVGEEPSRPAPFFASCVVAARTRNPWGVPEERAVPVTLCRGRRTSLQALWPGLKGRQ